MKLKILAALTVVGSILISPLVANATATSAHFVPSSFTGIKDPASGNLVLGAQVAGLGNKGIAIIEARGWVSVTMTCVKGSNSRTITDRQVRINEHNIQSDRNGNYKVSETLNNPTTCPSGFTLQSRSVSWSEVTLTLKDYPSRAVIQVYNYSNF